MNDFSRTAPAANHHAELKQFGENITANLDIVSFQGMKSYLEANAVHMISAMRSNIKGYLDETKLKDVVFVRNFYDALLTTILHRFADVDFLNVLLLGNQGIGKSTFQAYLLYRLINGRNDPSLAIKPEVIIRHISGSEKCYEVYILGSGKVYTATALSLIVEERALGKILRLYEPDTDRSPPPNTGNLMTLSTLSLYSPRVKEIKKKSTATLYMPVWTKPELVALGRYYHRRLPDSEVKYDDETVARRYDQYGGIIRFVLPSSVEKEIEVKEKRGEKLHFPAPRTISK